MRTVIGLVLLAALVGCATTQAQADRRASHASERTVVAMSAARTRYLRAHDLAPVQVETRTDDLYGGVDRSGAPPALPVAADIGLRGEYLTEIAPATAGGAVQIGLVTPTIACGCGCRQTTTYEVARTASGDLVVMRLTARTHVEVIKVAGSCGFGCGTQPPPIPGTTLILPTADPSRIRIADVPYDEYLVDITCDHPVPVP